MSSKFYLPNFKDHLVSQGVKIAEFHRAAYKAVGDDNVSNRLWSDAMNGKGVGATSINKMVHVAPQALQELKKECPDDAIKIEEQPASNDHSPTESKKI